MSRCELETQVNLDALSEGQLEIVRGTVLGALVAQAADLGLLHKLRDPKGAIREVAALGRLALWLERGQILVPDSAARAAAQSLAEGVDAMNEWDEVIERYEEATAEHDALHAFVAHFSGPGSGGTQDG